jgi:serine/threonine protein kinase
MSLSPGARLGPYEITAPLGEGGMGEVYLARDSRLKRDVALKILPSAVVSSPDRRARFEREAQAAAALSHPNICTIFDVGDADGQPYIAMEYCEGATLAARLREHSFTIPETLDIAQQIADGLGEAHRRRILHRDIKPANILITPRGQVKILDFGLAKEVAAHDSTDATTAAGLTSDLDVVMGTVAYMSPEQALGKVLDTRSDLFSFGIVLYEMLAGRLPFGGSTQTAHIDAILHEDPPPIGRFNDRVPESLQRLVRRMLEKDPDRRTQSAREVWNDLREIRESLSGSLAASSVPISQPRRGASAARRNIAILTAVLVLASAAGVWYWRGRTPADSGRTSARRLVLMPAKVIAPAQLAGDYAYLTDAVPSTLFADLADVEGLEMQSPPNSIQVASLGGDIGRVMKAYEADLYLESDITADKTQLSWNVRLVEWPSRTTMWKKSYPGHETTYLQMVHQAADEIHASLVPQRREVPDSMRASGNSELELEYQDGLFYSRRYLSKGDLADFDRALASLKHVFAVDPERAEVAGEISILISRKVLFLGPAEDVVAEARQWAQRGIDTNPKCGRCWAGASNAVRYVPSADQRTQLSYALKSVLFGGKTSPNHRTLAIALNNAGGSASLALEAARAASRVDPLDLSSLNNVGFFLFLTGHPEQSIADLDKLLSIEPNLVYGQLTLIPSLADANRINDAEAVLRRLEAMPAERQPVVWMPVMRAVVQFGRRDFQAASATLAAIRKSVTSPNMTGSLISEIASNLAPALIRVKRLDDVFALLQLGIDRGAVPDYEWLMLNPQLAPLREDARFGAIAAKARQHYGEIIDVLNEAKSRGELPAYLQAPLADLTARLPR